MNLLGHFGEYYIAGVEWNLVWPMIDNSSSRSPQVFIFNEILLQLEQHDDGGTIF